MLRAPLLQSNRGKFSTSSWFQTLFSGPSSVIRYKFTSPEEERKFGLLFLSVQAFLFIVFNLGLNIPSIVFASKSMHACTTKDSWGRNTYDVRLPTWLLTSAIIQISTGLILLFGHAVLYLPKRTESYSTSTGRKISTVNSIFVGISSTLIMAMTILGFVFLFSSAGRNCRQAPQSLGGATFGLSVASLIIGTIWVLENARVMYLKTRKEVEGDEIQNIMG